MAKESNGTADLEFRDEILSRLVGHLDCDEDLRASLRLFLTGITADANNKHLAYHLFCSVTLYISKYITLSQEQMSAVCQIIEKLRKEWGDDDPVAETSNGQSSTRTPEHDVFSGRSDPYSAATSPLVNSEVTGIPAIRNITGCNVDNVCEKLESADFASRTFPRSFVPKAEKHVPIPPNFHDAVKSDDTATLKSKYPFGYRVMRQQGWSDQTGLGRDRSGIQQPIDAHALAQGFKDESLFELGYARKAHSRVSTNKTPLEKAEKNPNESGGMPTSWHQYVSDPNAGDKTAKTVYGQSDAVKHQRVPVAIRTTLQAKAGTKVITQDQYAINDNWKDTSKNKNASHAQGIIPQLRSGLATEGIGVETDAFVPHSNRSEG
ncbi:hypothetical protein F4802DRAFT_615961 [Xylaria palmicola]|nr:hypothetical protein F4802DRAFT_615961 [Xylaria palmicola]